MQGFSKCGIGCYFAGGDLLEQCINALLKFRYLLGHGVCRERFEQL